MLSIEIGVQQCWALQLGAMLSIAIGVWVSAMLSIANGVQACISTRYNGVGVLVF